MLRRYRRICENEDKSLERLVKLICTDEKLFNLNYDIFYNNDTVDYGDEFGDCIYFDDNIKEAIIDVIQYDRNVNKPICDGNFSCYFVYPRSIPSDVPLYTFYDKSDMIKTLRKLYCNYKLWEGYAECSPMTVQNFRDDIQGLTSEEFESFVDEIK